MQSTVQADKTEQANLARFHGAEIPEGFIDRGMAIRLIRDALKRRSGRPWSVTGGRGTAYGWLSIMPMPARRVCRHQFDGAECPSPEQCAEHRRYMSDGDRAELARLLGVEDVHFQGQSIPSGTADYLLWIARAQTGKSCGFHAAPSWD